MKRCAKRKHCASSPQECERCRLVWNVAPYDLFVEKPFTVKRRKSLESMNKKKTTIIYEDELHTTWGGAWITSYSNSDETYSKPKNSSVDKKVKRAGWGKQFYE